MQLFIEGYRSYNYYLYNAITDAVWFYAEELLGKRLMKNLEIDIKLTKDLKKKEGATVIGGGEGKKVKKFPILGRILTV